MRCEDAILELDAYLSGELDPEATWHVERHLEECSACAAELMTLRKEHSLYQAFASAIEVPPDAWKTISRRTGFFAEAPDQQEAPRGKVSSVVSGMRPGHWLRWAVAASLVIASGLAIYFYQSRRAAEPDRSATNSPAIIEDFNLDETVIGLNQALEALDLAFNQKKDELDPQTISELDRNIGVINKAIAECQEALKENPRNEQAAEFLVVAYEKKIDVLKQITED